MDNKDCTLTITCNASQEEGGDEVYVIVTDNEGKAKRRPPDSKRFELKAGDPAVTLRSHRPEKLELWENDVMTADDLLGSVTLTEGVDGKEVIENKGAKYTVEFHWF